MSNVRRCGYLAAIVAASTALSAGIRSAPQSQPVAVQRFTPIPVPPGFLPTAEVERRFDRCFTTSASLLDSAALPCLAVPGPLRRPLMSDRASHYLLFSGTTQPAPQPNRVSLEK